MSLEKIYLLIGLTTTSLFLAGGSAQAQTQKSPDRNTLIVAENVATIAPFNSTDTKTNSVLMAQFSTPQPNGTTQTPSDNTVPSNGTSTPLDGTVPREGTPATEPTPLDNTVPSDRTPTTEPTPLDNTVPSDRTPATEQTPVDNTVPSDGTPTTPSTQTAPFDGTPTTPSSNPTPPPSDGNSGPLNDVNPGRATRSGSSYIGVGGNIGIGGNTGIGEGSFSVLSKVGLTRYLSVRPAVLFGDQTTVLLPVTFDLPIRNVETTRRFNIAPYVGGGAVISTGDNSTVGLLLTGGVDVPINSRFTATAGVNVGFVDNTDVGVLLGVGYNFSGL